MAILTIARQEGAWGEDVATKVAARLSAEIIDGELLNLAAAHSGVPVEILCSMDERGRSLWRYPADVWKTVPVPVGHSEHLDHSDPDRYPPTGPVHTHSRDILSTAFWATEHYQQLVSLTIRKVAAEQHRGHVVIVGRGGQCVLGNAVGTVHALLVAPSALRIERIRRATKINRRSAAAQVKRTDQDRTAFHRQLGGVDWLSPELYDYVISTERVSTDLAADLLSTAVNAAPTYQPAPNLEHEPARAGH